MAKLKKILSILMVCVMGAGALCACAPDADSAQQDGGHASESGELAIFKSDYTIPAEDRLSRIKAEYLIENKGYREDDEVVAILSLDGDALIDSYLGDAELSEKISLAEYAASPAGRQKKTGIDFMQTDLIRRLQSEGLIGEVEYRYSTIANAIAVKTTYSDFCTLEQEGYVKSAALSETYSRPLEAEGTDASAIENIVDVYETGIFNSSSAQDPQGNPYTGKGTSVAVLDSGFDLGHPAFNTHLLTDESELMFTRNDIRDVLATNEMRSESLSEGLVVSDVFYSNKIPYKFDYADKDPDVFPYDSEHGTHVAGIIGGYAESYQDKDKNTPTDENGTPLKFRGIAIDTQLVLMKVFPDLTTGAQTPDILAALEDSVLLGVDAINMSLGAACGFAREEDGDIVNTVYDKINESGVSLITAAGNEYSSGYGGAQGNTNFVTNPDSGTIGSPASYAPSLSVASISGVKSKYLVGNDEQVLFFNESSSISGDENDFFAELFADVENKGEKYNFGDGEYADRYDKLQVGSDGTLVLDYVTIPGYGYRANYTAVNVKGKIALVSRGDNTFEDKALQAKNAGAIGCIIYNNIDGDIRMSMGKTDHIPTISISKEDGVKLAEHRTGTLTLNYDQQAGPFMSDFSCWGPLADLTLKPEITAHGGNITSSFPGGGYGTISGTSMACPNLCGLVVLIRQFIKDQPRYEEMSWKEISVLTNQMLMSTATIIYNEQGNPYSPRKQGAGLASLYNVVNTKAYIEVQDKNGNVKDRSKIELGDDPQRTGVFTMYFNIVNTSSQAVGYELGLIGMTESVSTADSDHVAERDQLLSNNFTAKATNDGGTVSGTKATVNANSTLKVELTYTLSEEDKELIDELFPYGMYVEGFVTLASDEENGIDLNVPFLAFFGDWTQAPIFDKTYYEVETEAHNAGIDEEDKLKADYYATTPYGSYWYNYIIPLGTFLYNIDTSSYDPIPATEDRIAISDSLGSIDGIGTIYAGLLRNCKTMEYTITDKATGEVIFNYVNTNARKAFSQGGSPIPGYDEDFKFRSADYGLVNNRQYEFKMVGTLDYARDSAATNARNSFSFDFMFDTEAPIIKSATYEKVYDRTRKKDRYYINLTVYDNNYAMALTPGIFTPNPEYGTVQGVPQIQFTSVTASSIPLYGGKGEETTVRYEITDLLPNVKYDEAIPNALVFSVEDYALNQNLFVCQLPGTRGAFSFTEDGETDGKALRQLTINVDEVRDLTQYLATTDGTVDENKDYLKYLTWTSSNPNVAAVENGQVRGLAAGRTTITVVERMLGIQATISVNVLGKGAATAANISFADPVATPLSFDDVEDASRESIKELRFAYFDTLFAHARAGQTSDIGSTGDRIFLTAHRGGISMYPGETISLTADVSPWYVRDKYHYVFESDRPDLVSVQPDGTVQALKKGPATISLRVYDDEGNIASNLMATLSITVNSEFVIDDARTLVAYKGMGGDVVIPDDEGILYIGPFSFSLYETNTRYEQELPENDIYANRIPQKNENVTSVVVPKGVMEIQQNAFYNCLKLKTVQLPDSVKILRQNTFTGDVALTDINLDNVEVVGANAFAGCSALEHVDMPKCYSIGTAGFKNCTALASVDLTHLRNTGAQAFMGCTDLSSVVLGPLTKLSEHIFDGCGLTEVDIKESNIIPAYAFANNRSLASVTFSSETGLELIDANAFAGDVGLTAVTLPNSAFTLGDSVFAGCTQLTRVRLQANTRITVAQGTLFAGSGVTTFEIVGNNANYTVSGDGHQLLSGNEIVLAAIGAYEGALEIPETVTAIRSGAFAGAKITELTFKGAIALGESAFEGCASLAKVTFAADAVSEIGNNAFANCTALNTVENLNTASKIGDRAFANITALQSVVLGDGTTVGTGAFTGSGLRQVTLGKDAAIGAEAFANCAELLTVTMPAEGGVKLGRYAFSQDTKLSTIDLGKASGEIGERAFFGCRSITVADLSNITAIGTLAFANCAKLATVTLGASLTSIGYGAFMDYTYLMSGSSARYSPVFTQIEIPDTLKTMGAAAFYGCRNLTSVAIPSTFTEVPANAFAYCNALTTVTLPQGCTKVGDYAFAGCTALASIDLSKVETIGEGAFSTAGNAQTPFITENSFAAVKTMGEGAFADSSLSGEISAPVLETLGDYAFQNAGFTSIDAPKLATIGEGAFQGNRALSGFNFSESLTWIGERAFYGCTSVATFTFGSEKKTDGAINDYAKLEEGILYTALPNGKQQLTSVPAGYVIQSLTVDEGTTRIDSYAGNANTRISSLILPDSLETIGEYAFYGYNALRSVEFRSVTAPKLECSYSSSVSLQETDPGYDILHNQYGMYNEEMHYFNFIALVGKREPISMVLPKNSDISGYDSVIYYVYFGAVEDATRSDYVAMEQSMKDFLWYGRLVEALETVTLNDEALVSKAVVALNGVKQNPQNYNISNEEWTKLASAVTAARERIVRLKVEYASKTIRDIQARIDALPDTYSDTEDMNALILALRDDIANLEMDDRNLLIQDKYTALLAAYEAAHPETPPESGDNNGEQPGDREEDGNGWIWAIVGVGIAIVVAAAVVTVVVILKKKKSHSAEIAENAPETSETEEPQAQDESTEQADDTQDGDEDQN